MYFFLSICKKRTFCCKVVECKMNMLTTYIWNEAFSSLLLEFYFGLELQWQINPSPLALHYLWPLNCMKYIPEPVEWRWLFQFTYWTQSHPCLWLKLKCGSLPAFHFHIHCFSTVVLLINCVLCLCVCVQRWAEKIEAVFLYLLPLHISFFKNIMSGVFNVKSQKLYQVLYYEEYVQEFSAYLNIRFTLGCNYFFLLYLL